MSDNTPKKEESKYSSILIQREDTSELARRTGQKFDMQITPETIWSDVQNIKNHYLNILGNRNELIRLHSEVVKLYRIADKLYCGSSYFGLTKERQQLLKNCITELRSLKTKLFQDCQNLKSGEDQNE